MKFLGKLLVTALAVLVTSYLLKRGVTLDGMLGALIVAAVLALLNAIVKPLMILLTFPVTIMTLGLFLLVINACIILLASELVRGFEVNGFWWALLFSLILSIVNAIFESLASRAEQ